MNHNNHIQYEVALQTVYQIKKALICESTDNANKSLLCSHSHHLQ
jgi:hypothetical protein